MSVSTTVLTDDDGKVELVQGVVRDIDQRKRAQLALQASLDEERAASERSARLNEMTSTFLTAISHELRTPLTSVLGFADVLATRRAQLSDDQQHQLLERFRVNAHRLQRLLEEVLDVDRLARGELAPEIRPVRLDRLVDQVLRETDHDGTGAASPSRRWRSSATPGIWSGSWPTWSATRCDTPHRGPLSS